MIQKKSLIITCLVLIFTAINISIFAYNYGSKSLNPYKNKRVAIFGDSISEPGGVNAPTTKKYWYEYLSEDLNFNYKTYAFSGNQWTDVLIQSQKAFEDQRKQNYEYDVIIIFAGTNDFYFNVPIGEFYQENNGVRKINYNDATFKGRLNKTLHYVKSKFPNAQIVVCNILHRGFAHGTPSELSPNNLGFYLDQYSTSIDEATLIWSTPLIDLRRESSLLPLSEMSSYYKNGKNDMLHPNENGHFRLFKVIKNRLLSLPVW